MKPDHLKRIPTTNHPSLKAWNAADELMVDSTSENAGIGIYNDAFGYLSCNFARQAPLVVTDLKSQKAAILENLETNNLTIPTENFFLISDTLPELIQLALLQIPKSLPLFENYLQHIHRHLSPDGKVICGFMTKYFTPTWLNMVGNYFENVEQSKAKKKARLLILSGKKNIEYRELIESFDYHNLRLEQYRGVFSSGKVDKATDFLLQHLEVPESHANIMDLACGNGVIGKWILNHGNPENLHLLDDSNLALQSAQLNIRDQRAQFHHQYDLQEFADNSLDWIVTNPPFHFGNTIDTSIPINLFKSAYHKLKKGGILTIVANSNLGYDGFLKHQFQRVKISASNRQFKVYQCWA